MGTRQYKGITRGYIMGGNLGLYWDNGKKEKGNHYKTELYRFKRAGYRLPFGV